MTIDRSFHEDAKVVVHVDGLDPEDFPTWVSLLRDPLRAKRAFRHLVESGPAALPAVRARLRDEDGDIRMHCARVLDHLVDEDAFPELVAMLDDHDPRVRLHTLHALACDRCKENACGPDKSTVLPRAIDLLRTDPSEHVRSMACEVVGKWVHDDEVAADALTKAHHDDPVPMVRKKAGWFAPGGTIFEKTVPRPVSRRQG